MKPVSLGAARYDGVTVWLHWTMAVLVVAQWIIAEVIDWFPTRSEKVEVRSLHITLGLLLAALFVGRILWRLTKGRHLPLVDDGVLAVLAKIAHWILYGLLGAMVLAGMALTWARGDTIFGLINIPSFAPGNRALIDRIDNIHNTIGWMILALAGLHSAAALVHRYVWNDGVLDRMLPHNKNAIG